MRVTTWMVISYLFAFGQVMVNSVYISSNSVEKNVCKIKKNRGERSHSCGRCISCEKLVTGRMSVDLIKDFTYI